MRPAEKSVQIEGLRQVMNRREFIKTAGIGTACLLAG
ncbi:MAG: twin-arginine translocation signal domain-containing protein [Selenomonas ruminantium]|nr:twin-arginine translocation signal domain-containing protein [Selenomonas ruminantium]